MASNKYSNFYPVAVCSFTGYIFMVLIEVKKLFLMFTQKQN